MGQDQSTASEGGLSLLQKAKGIGPKVPRANKIVVVASGSEKPSEDPKQDADFLKLQEIPQFYPILRSVLAIPGVKDPPDLYTKLEPKVNVELARRFQDHLITTSEIVSVEQSAICTRLREIDYAIATLNNYMHDRHKSYATYSQAILKIRDLNQELKRVSAALQDVVPSLNAFNRMLPEGYKLPPLNLEPSAPPHNFTPTGTVEQVVVDVQDRDTGRDSPSWS